jgi:hypothetical protein
VLKYGGLKVWDADGVILASSFEAADGNRIQLQIDEAGARYPLTIDPVAQQAYLKAGNNGGQSDDLFGSSVSVSGDTVARRCSPGRRQHDRGGQYARRGRTPQIGTGLFWLC